MSKYSPSGNKSEGITDGRNSICKTKEVCVSLFCWGAHKQFWKESIVCWGVGVMAEDDPEDIAWNQISKGLICQAKMFTPFCGK